MVINQCKSHSKYARRETYFCILLVKSTQIRIVNTLFQLMWHQTEIRLVLQINRKSVCTKLISQRVIYIYYAMHVLTILIRQNTGSIFVSFFECINDTMIFHCIPNRCSYI